MTTMEARDLEAMTARALEAERERDEAVARADAFTALRLKRANIESGEGGWSADLAMEITPEAREAFAVTVAGILDSEPRAVNYLEIKVVHPEGREYAVTCQRVERKTPHQFRVEAESRALAAEAEAKRLRKALRGLESRYEPGVFCDHAAEPCPRCDAARAALKETR